jgi:hypothetical protein
MHNNYSVSVYALLFLSTALQFLACWTVLKRGYFAHWKAFSYYLFCMTLGSVAGIFGARFGSVDTYRLIYAGSAIVEAITLILVVFEIMVKMLEPFDALPGRVVARFGFWAAIGISAAITLSVWVGTTTADLGWAPPLTVERTVFLADATLLWLLIVQARALGVTWQSSVAEIAVAFVLYLTVQSAVRFIIIIYPTNERVMDIASGFGQFAYVISLCSWIWTMRHRDPAAVQTSPEKLAEVHALASQHGAVPKEKIFAAVGIKITKIETEMEQVNQPVESDRAAKALLN